MDERKKKVRAYFDEIVAAYSRLYEDADRLACYPSGPARLDKALDLVTRFKSSGKVLDVGCGTGVLARELVERGYEVICMDIAPEMVDKAREMFEERLGTLPDEVSFAVGDVEDLKFDDASLDVVTALGVIEYLATDEAALGEIARTLRPDGIAVIAFPNRLFNLFSLNQFTEEEVASGAYADLLDELRTEMATGMWDISLSEYADDLGALVEHLASKPKNIVQERLFAPSPVKVRRYTPNEARRLAAGVGLASIGLSYFHFHPFPPVFEKADPITYNALGTAMEALGETPIGACMASGFVAAFRKS